MDQQSLERYKKIILTILRNSNKGVYDIRQHSPFLLIKRGVPERFIAKVIAEFVLNNDIISTKLFKYLTNSEIYNSLLKNKNTSNLILSIIEKFHSFFDRDDIGYFIVNTNFDIEFFKKMQNILNFSRFGFLFRTVDDFEMWEMDKVKSFFIWFLNNPEHIRNDYDHLYNYFPKMDRVLKLFLVYKTEFISLLNSSDIIRLINKLSIQSDLDVVKKIIKSYTEDYITLDNIRIDIKELYHFYYKISDEFKPLVSPSKKELFQKIYRSAINNDYTEQLLELIIEDMGRFDVHDFFSYNPGFINYIKENYDNEELIYKLKFATPGVPDEVKNQLTLKMDEEVVLDGDEVTMLVYKDRDGVYNYVKYYVNEVLWQKTIDWDYGVSNNDIDQYYWDDLNEKNLNKIKEILKEENPDADLDDEDVLKELALEDDHISRELRSASENALRSGDENELTKDIHNVLDKLFPRGWSLDVHGLKTTISLSDLDEDEITDGYENCGEWDIKCIWLDRMGDRSNRDKPSLPDYGYGIQGEFDIDAFNDNLEGNL